ncbi:retrovirus-related pol polyprotein from transposon TNT 1-94 [Tanacetum coccineum]
MQNVLIPCHDKCLAKHKLNVHSNVRRTFSTNSRTPKSLETTYVALKTRFSKKETQSKTLDTTSVVSKSKIDVESASKAKDKVSSASRIKKTNLRDKPLSTFIKNKIRTSRIWQKWFESQPNVIWTPVSIKLNVHNTRSSEKPSVVQIVLWVVDSGCSKHMTGDRSLLRNFINKFMGTVRFGNDNFEAITCYGDYIHGNITIHHVYYVKGLGHNLFSVGQFCYGDLEVAFCSNTMYEICKEMICSQVDVIPICILSLFLTGLLLYSFVHVKDFNKVMVMDRRLPSMQQFSIARTPQQNGVVERRNRTLAEAARTMLIFSKLPEFLWAEAVAIACFTQNRSIGTDNHRLELWFLVNYGAFSIVKYFLGFPGIARREAARICTL